MKLCKFCWKSSLLSVALFCGCATANLPPVSLSKVEANSNKIFNYYCENNKQIRKLSVPIEYVTPQLPKMALDIAAKEQAYYSKDKRRLLKKSLFSLSGGEERPNGRGADYLNVRQSDLKQKEVFEKVSSYEIHAHDSQRVRGLLMKPVDSNKFILFYGIETDQRFSDQDHYEPTHISELKILVENFTILEPVKYQDATYQSDEDETEDVIATPSDSIAIDSAGSQVISEAIEHKDEIWIRYINHFTKIKEAKSKNPRVINVDLELDLNGFCRYGRKISVLQSQ